MNPFNEVAAAVEAERAAWLAVKDHLPGTDGHDPRLWDAWLGALQRCKEARSSAWAPPHEGNAPPPAAPRWR